MTGVNKQQNITKSASRPQTCRADHIAEIYPAISRLITRLLAKQHEVAVRQYVFDDVTRDITDSSRGPLAKRHGSCSKVMRIRFKYMACTVVTKQHGTAADKNNSPTSDKKRNSASGSNEHHFKARTTVTIDYFTSASRQESIETDDHSYARKMKEWLLGKTPSQLRGRLHGRVPGTGLPLHSPLGHFKPRPQSHFVGYISRSMGRNNYILRVVPCRHAKVVES